MTACTFVRRAGAGSHMRGWKMLEATCEEIFGSPLRERLSIDFVPLDLPLRT
jgi:hypothetical protein